MDLPPEDDVCSICHDAFTVPCQANCSHWFCAACILRVWHHGSALHPCKCPICRRSITLLVPSQASSEHFVTTGEISRYNQMFGEGPRSLAQKLSDLPFFLRRLARDFTNPQRTLPLLIKARIIFTIVLAAVYIISPIDILPEGVFGFVGLLDDLLVLMVVFLHLSAMYRSLLLYRHGGSSSFH